MEEQDKREKFSYSKIDTYEECGWRYKLKYVDKHFVDTSSIATEFGTLVHFVEETMANDIKENGNAPNFLINYNKYEDLFINGYKDEKETILGAEALRDKYPNEFYKKNKQNLNYADKANNYLEKGMFRLRDYLNANPNLEIVDTEKEFTLEFRGYTFTGSIDRVFRDKTTGKLIIEDIKTWTSTENHNLATPLQFVIYTSAAQQIYGTENIECAYELPLIEEKHSAGSKGYMTRGYKKLNKLMDAIEAGDFKPNATPLCFWCPYSKTNPNQKEEAKNLCPYYCNWTETNRDFTQDFEWMGRENHEKILEAFINKNKESIQIIPSEEIKINNFNERRFFLRK